MKQSYHKKSVSCACSSTTCVHTDTNANANLQMIGDGFISFIVMLVTIAITNNHVTGCFIAYLVSHAA